MSLAQQEKLAAYWDLAVLQFYLRDTTTLVLQTDKDADLPSACGFSVGFDDLVQWLCKASVLYPHLNDALCLRGVGCTLREAVYLRLKHPFRRYARAARASLFSPVPPPCKVQCSVAAC